MSDVQVFWLTDPEADAISSPFVRQPAYSILKDERDALAAELSAAHTRTEDHRESARSFSAQCIAQEARIAALEAALTPSAETKGTYIGQFTLNFPMFDEDGKDVMREVNVPWTTIKKIMEFIRKRAAETPVSVSASGTVRRSVRDMVVPPAAAGNAKPAKPIDVRCNACGTTEHSPTTGFLVHRDWCLCMAKNQ